MSIENKLKNYIMTRYSSLREFTIESDIPYSTVNAILKRGIANSSLSNVSKICKALNISLDELEHNRIVPLDKSDKNEEYIELNNTIQYYKFKIQKTENITLDDRPLTIKDPNCKNKHWKLSELTDLVFNEIKQLALDPEYMHELREDEPEDNRTEVIQAEIEKINNKMSKLMDLYILDTMSKEVLTEKVHELNEQKNKLEAEIDNIRAEELTKLTKEEISNIVKDFPEVLDRGDFEEIRTVIGELIERIDIDNEDITIHWNF